MSMELHLHAAHNWGRRTVGKILLSGASFMFDADKNHKNHVDAADGAFSSVEFSSLVDLDVATTTTAAGWLGLLDSDNSNYFFSQAILDYISGGAKAAPSEFCHCPKTVALGAGWSVPRT